MNRLFEWDPKKNEKNVARHKIDFTDAAMFFEHPYLQRLDTRKDYKEERWISIGQLNAIIMVAVYTFREEKIRIISIRKANHYERKIYIKKFGKPEQLETATSKK